MSSDITTNRKRFVILEPKLIEIIQRIISILSYYLILVITDKTKVLLTKALRYLRSVDQDIRFVHLYNFYLHMCD